MRGCLIVLVIGCSAKQGAIENRASAAAPPSTLDAAGCPTLPAGFSYRPRSGPHHRDDEVTLIPPYTVRAVRHGKLTTHCEIELSACGRDNTYTADDVIAVITGPEVTSALAKHAVLGDVAAGDPLVVLHDGHTLTIGAACKSAPCVAIPDRVARMAEVLDKVYEWRITPTECPSL